MLDHWRARVGWIHPRVNSDIEVYDFYKAAPEDVVLVVTHLEVVDSAKREEVEASLKLLQRAVERLHFSKVDSIMTNGAPVHLHHGVDGTGIFWRGCGPYRRFRFRRVPRPWRTRSTSWVPEKSS